MNENQKKRPLVKVNVRVKRTSENSCVSTQKDELSVHPDLISEVLPLALEEEERAEGRSVLIADDQLKTAENKKTEAEPVAFVSVDLKSEISKEISDEITDPLFANKEFEEKKTEKLKLFTRFSEMSSIRKCLVIISGFFCMWSLLPLIKGICGIGLYAPLFIGLFAMFTIAAWDFIVLVKSGLWKLLWLIISIVAMAGAVAFAFVSGHMVSASNNNPPEENTNITVVVLGCKVNGTEPSKMLKGRLDKAAEYLLTHPGINCIVTGGMGSDEAVSEAAVMKQYLVKKGVSSSRIKTEDKSTSTRENFRNAIEVAKSNNYYTTFCVVTDRFHQLRAKMICDELDITSYAVSCETPWYLTMYYWFREMFGIAHHTVYKN